MDKRLCAVRFLFCMLGLLTMLGCDDGPVIKVKDANGDSYSLWMPLKWRHPSCPLIDETKVNTALDDAWHRWRNVAPAPTVPKDLDVSVHVVFKSPDGISTMTGYIYNQDKYNEIKNEVDLAFLSQAEQNPAGVGGWIRIVQDVYFNNMRWAGAEPNKRSVVIPLPYAYQGGVYAHEFGHNAGLEHRLGGTNGLINIMQQMENGLNRQLASAKERRIMENWMGH